MHTLLIKILLASVFLLPDQYNLVKKIEINTEFIDVDNFGQLYIYTNNNLKKYSKSGIFISQFSNRIEGSISSVDVSDPYILLLFYEDLNRIIFLDDKLSPIGSPLNLDELELFNVSTVCKSKEFAIWIYDRFDNRLIQYGFNPKEILQEINLDPLNIDEGVVFMRESGNYLVLNTSKQLIIFDRFGTYIKSIDIEIAKAFQLQNKRIIWFKDKHFVTESIETEETDSLAINFIVDIENALIEDHQVYIRKKDSVLIYRETD